MSGWGETSSLSKVLPYWGFARFDIAAILNARGYETHAASVSPLGSAWDRTCELYAQLTGTRTDYGAEHSARCKHARYGEDYTGKAILSSFSSKDKINLFGHSFGGATILQFLQLMYAGSEAEQKATTDGSLSDFFKGGKGDWIHAIVTLSAPMNGTTAYAVRDEINVDPHATPEEKAGAVQPSLRQLRTVLDTIDFPA